MRGTPVRYIDFTGGVNTKAAPYLVALNECRDCRNVVSTTRGSIKKRNGNVTFCSSFAGSPTAIMSLFGCQAAATVLIATHGTKISSISTGGTATDITGAATLTTGLRWDFIEAPTNGGQGPLYGSNGTDTPKHWTGSGNIADWTASSGSVPVASYLVYFKNRVWAAGVSSTPSRLYFSDIGNPRSWPAANVVDFEPSDGDSITGLGTIGPYLLVFKKTKTWVVYDLDTGANRQLSRSVGCPAHRSIVESPRGTFFLSQDQGVWITDGKKLNLVSEKITPTLTNIAQSQRVNACGEYVNDHYYLSISLGGTNNDMTLDYDTLIKSWWLHTNDSNQFATWRPTADVQLYSAIPDTGRVDQLYVANTLQDNGANFTWYWAGPWISFGEPYRNKRLRQIHVDGTGIVDAYLGKDYLSQSAVTLIQTDIFNYTSSASTFGGSGNFGGAGIFGDTPALASRRLYSLGVGRAFSFFIQGTSAQVAEMDSYTPYITLRQN